MEEDRIVTYGYARDNFSRFKKYDTTIDFLEPKKGMTKEALTTYYSFDPTLIRSYPKNRLLPVKSIKSYDLPIPLESPLSMYVHGNKNYKSSVIDGISEENGISSYGVQSNDGCSFYRCAISDVAFFAQNEHVVTTDSIASGQFGPTLSQVLSKACNVDLKYFEFNFQIKSIALQEPDTYQPMPLADLIKDPESGEVLDFSYYQPYQYFNFDMFCKHDVNVPSAPNNTSNKVFYNILYSGLSGPSDVGRIDRVSFGSREVLQQVTRNKKNEAFHDVLYSYKPFTIEMEFKAIGSSLDIYLGTVYLKMFQEKL